jgi:hypothetical protein
MPVLMKLTSLGMEEWKDDEPEINGRLSTEQNIGHCFIDWGRFHPLTGIPGERYKIESMLRIYSNRTVGVA